MRDNFEKRFLEVTIDNLDERTTRNAKSFEEELTLYQFMLDQKIIMQEEYERIAADLSRVYSEQEWQMKIDGFTKVSNQVTEIASNLASSIQNINRISSEKELKDIDDISESRKISANKYIKNKKLLESELAKIDAEASKKRDEIAKRDKQIAMIMSIINTAQAVTGALTMMPPPVGIAMAVIVGALGAIQTGIIASQAFADGGIVQPNGGPTTGDRTQVRVNPGEMILNQRQQRNLFDLANSPVNTYAGGGVSIQETIVVQGNMDSSAIQELKQHREEWLEMLRDSNKQLNYRGYTYAT